jgi:nitroreductase
MIPQSTAGLDHADPAPWAQSLSFIYHRHAVRSYQPVVVDPWTIRTLLDAAVHAPTAMNEQPWRFVVIQDAALLRKISDRAKTIAVASAAHHSNLLKPPGASGDGIRSVLADPEFNIFYDATTLIVICAETTTEFVTADCWLAAENLMLGASASGLGTCVIGFAVEAMNTAEIKQTLGIPEELTVVAPIILGVPREKPMPTPRKLPVVLNWLRG